MEGRLETLRKCPVTLSVAGLSILGFVFFDPSHSAYFSHLFLPLKLIAASLLHVNLAHLSLNLALWGLAGWHLEPRIGSKRLAGIAILAILVGGILETYGVDDKFVGLSAGCYGLVGALIWQQLVKDFDAKSILKGGLVLIGFGALDIIFNLVISPVQVANFAHIGGLMAGFLSSLGFAKNGGDEPNRVFRPMADSDVGAILEIIYDHDEDDGDEAKTAFDASLDDKYVMEYEGRVMGMTGFKTDPYAPQSAWLSFTYIHDYFRKKGNAYWMMLQLRQRLAADGIERVFIATSDYIDEETGEDIYLAARDFYENKLNARRELFLENFYAPGESKYIYSLPVNDEDPRPALSTLPSGSTARFIGLEDLPESDTSYTVLWEEMSTDSDEPKSTRQTKTLTELFQEVQTYGGKVIFLTLPNYISDNHAMDLKSVGFRELGVLTDYFGPGINEVHWGRYFD